jgi:cytochrome c
MMYPHKKPLPSVPAALTLVACALLAGSAHAGEPAAGKTLFDKTCANCHSVEVGANKVGPTLFDIINRPIASVQGYDYSKKMLSVRKQWKLWDEQHLDAYLAHPREALHGVKMFFAVPEAKDRADVIAYLKTLK